MSSFLFGTKWFPCKDGRALSWESQIWSVWYTASKKCTYLGVRELKQTTTTTATKPPTNFHIWPWKTEFLHALHVHFSSFDILKTFSFFLWREMTCFAVVWTTWAYDDKCMFNFVFLCPKRWFQINSRTVRRHLSSIMTLNNWNMIAEKRSYIFRWRSRFRRRRVCLSSLLPHVQHDDFCFNEPIVSLIHYGVHVVVVVA